MTATTEDYSPVDNKFAIFSNLDKDLQFLGPSSPAVSTDPEVIVLPPPNSPTPYLSNPAQNDGKESPDSTSTIEASANDPTVEVPPTVGVQLKADNSNEDQYEPPIPSQPMVALVYRFQVSLNTALRPLIQSIAANIAESILLQDLQPLSDHESTPVFTTA